MKKHLIALLFIFSFPTISYANLVWPALYLSARMRDLEFIWVVGLGLIVEYFFYKKIAENNIKRALKMLFSANVISTICGIILIPISGIIWELISTPIRMIFDVGTFYPAAWIGTILFAAAANLLIEGFTVKILFKCQLTSSRLKFLYLANVLSISIIALTLLYHMPDM